MNDQSKASDAERPATPMRVALSKYRGGFIAIAVFSSLVNLLMLVSPIYMLQMYDRVLTSASAETLLMLTIIALFLLACFGALEWVRQRLMQRIGLALGLNMANDVLSSAFRSSLATQKQATSQPVRDLDSIRQFMGSPTVFAFFDIPWTPIFTAVVFMFHPLMGAVATFGAVVIFSLGLLAEFRSRLPMRAAAMEGIQSHQLLESSLRNSDSLKAMGMFDGLIKRWRGRHRLAASYQSAAAGRLSVLLSITKAFRFSVQVGILGTGAYLVLGGDLTPGMMIAGSIIMGRALAPIEQGIAAWRGFVGARQSWRRINGLLEGFGGEQAGESTELPRPEGKVEAENLVVVPPGSEAPAVRGVSFTLPAGTITGLIGPSGSGKSSLASAMMGVWPPHEGALRLDGAEIDGWPDHLRLRHFGYLRRPWNCSTAPSRRTSRAWRSPTTRVFSGPPNWRAATKSSCACRRITSPPSPVGDAAFPPVSGQRVALARALYGDPAYVVLDEPDSNLDSAGQEALSRVLDALRERRITTLLIKHNVRLLRRVDQIGVMNEGQLVSFGPRDDVLGQFTTAQAPAPRPADPPEAPPGPYRSSTSNEHSDSNPAAELAPEDAGFPLPDSGDATEDRSRPGH